MSKSTVRATVLVLSALLGSLQVQSASAGTFGASIDTYYGTLTPCVYSVVGSMPVKVDSPSHIYAHAVTTYSGQHNPSTSGGYYYIQIRPSDSPYPIAFGNAFSTQFFASPDTTSTLVSSGVLKDIGTGAAAKMPPGDYILEFIVEANTKLCDVSSPLPYVDTGNLTYMILSATLDQIFVTGFNAMLYGENRTKTVA